MKSDQESSDLGSKAETQNELKLVKRAKDSSRPL